jgi:HAE1 family hydrophobic/amphiphilic exporter-1
VSLACGILLILLSLCLVESERLSTKRMAGVVLGGLLALMCVTALLKISDARMEPLYWILLGLFLLLAFFDPDIRPGLIVAGSMPLSALFCFLLFQACGLTLNVMSLFGLALGLGMLVDNATVVYEHINELGLPPPGPAAREAALKATEEMVIPLIGGTVTNAIVFVPFLFLSREIQLMYTDVAAAVGASLFASLGISLTAVPLLASGLVLKGAPKWPAFPGRLESRAKKWGENINRWGTLLWERGAAYSMRALERARAFYAARLKPHFNSLAGHHSLTGLPPWAGLVLFVVLFAGLWALGGKTPAKIFFLLTALGLTAAGFALFRGFEGHWRGLFNRRVEILAAALLLAAAATAVIFKATERDFQTSGELDEFVVFLELSSGVRLEVSNAVAAEVEKILDTDPEVAPTIKTAVSRVEGWSSKIYVTLVPRAQRHLSAEQVQDLLRVKLKGVGSDKDPNAFVHFSSPRTGQEITVEVLGPDYGVLEQLAQQICGSLEKIPGLSDVKMRYRPGRPEVLAVVDPDRAARAGLSAEAVAETTHALVRGLRATTFRTGGRQTETIVRLRREDSENLNALADLPLGGPGRTLRLTEVADLTMSKMPNEIFRENKARLIQITANRTRLSLGRAAEEIQAALDAMNFPLDYHAALDREVTDMARSINQLTAGILVMIFLVYVVLVVLFESLVEPFIILSAVPLCLIGVAGGLVFFGLPLSTGVLVGVIMLAGVVVNNAIMLLDHLNNYTDRDEPLADRLRKSVLARMRPIFLTAGSAVLGFLPMMLDTSESGVLWRPLAVTLVFGLIFSTVLTLYVTPALTHFLLKDIPQWLTGRRFLAKTAPNPAP